MIMMTIMMMIPIANAINGNNNNIVLITILLATDSNCIDNAVFFFSILVRIVVSVLAFNVR